MPITETLSAGIHLYSPSGDHRDHPILCIRCHRRTMNICGHCNSHCIHHPPAGRTVGSRA